MANKKNKDKHPTIFVFEGSIRCYEEGSMLSLHTQVTNEEWQEIVQDTIKYKIFLECIKEVAIPKLNESWSEEDDWFRIQLEVAESRIRNIDPLIVSKIDQKELKEKYTKEMSLSADAMASYIEEIRNENIKAIREKYTIKTSKL